MSYLVTVADTDVAFPCDGDETVLDAAERAGFSLPYSCRKGVCSTCEAGLPAGSVEVRGRGPAQGPAQGVLLCQARPRSDLAIAPTRIARRGPPVRKVLDAKVFRVSRPAEDVTVLQLRFPTGVRAKFRAGQYLRVLLEDGDSRNYSLANPPHESDGAQLHIRHLAGGRFSHTLLPGLEKGASVRVELPYGEFSLNEESHKPVILVVTGTGFAPAKSIIEDQLKRGGGRPIHLYWGGRRREDLYLAELPAGWAARAPWFAFTPVLSQPGADWSGRTGRVHQAVLEDHPDLRGHEVYACGNPSMTAAAAEAFRDLAGLDPADFYCDAFVPSGAPEPSS
jgi:CDP-4-dehydro-6-deoxyglucose reductase/3-phenylpropionate/trans-cinnamate dioxygenase ferredoxin reductase subunit